MRSSRTLPSQTWQAQISQRSSAHFPRDRLRRKSNSRARSSGPALGRPDRKPSWALWQTHSLMLIKNLEKLRKRTLRERIYEEVVRLIVTGELPSGGWVDEKQVIDKLRVSRTPFREAIGILAKGGLVEIKPYRGFYVRSFSRNETADLYELYKRLECYAIEHPAPPISAPDTLRLENMLPDTLFTSHEP